MRVLWVDVDSLRPDHLGCYGYHRDTSPTIDAVAAQGRRFTNCYVSDSPCLPSRTALATGRFGIHNGVVGHGGTAADLPPRGRNRGFSTDRGARFWFQALQAAGYHTALISPFPQRHAAWWFTAGVREWHNSGRNGLDMAHEVNAMAEPWLERNAESDDWFLHVNYWDPHTPYRTPEEYGNPFAGDSPPHWYTEDIRRAHFDSYGPHSAQDTREWDAGSKWPRVPAQISSMDDWRKWIDGYDVGVRYMDDHLTRLLDILDRKRVLEDTVIVITADHGENLGELNIYGDHQTADECTNRVPFILSVPGAAAGVETGLHYQIDLVATALELLGGEVPALWDGWSRAAGWSARPLQSRLHLVLSQMAWSCQRSVRFDKWLMVRTYHDGLKAFPPRMLFDLESEPHEVDDVAADHPEVVNRAQSLLDEWTEEMMTSAEARPEDPMEIVLREGGPYHTRGMLMHYIERLRSTERAHHADGLLNRHARELD